MLQKHTSLKLNTIFQAFQYLSEQDNKKNISALVKAKISRETYNQIVQRKIESILQVQHIAETLIQ